MAMWPSAKLGRNFLTHMDLFGIFKKKKKSQEGEGNENFLDEFATSVSSCVLHQVSTVNDSPVFLRLYVSLNAHPPLKQLVLQL